MCPGALIWRGARLAVITPVAPHPTNGNGVIVADLSFEDDRWLTASPEALREALFTKGFDGPRPPLKVVSVNKVPALAPLSVLRSEDRSRLDLDLDRLDGVRARLSGWKGLASGWPKPLPGRSLPRRRRSMRPSMKDLFPGTIGRRLRRSARAPLWTLAATAAPAG
jgi:exodeoxyribonuclease-1